MVLTNFDFLGQGKPWPPRDETNRLRRYDRTILLFEGDHDRTFPGLNLVEDPKLNPVDAPNIVHIAVNWFKRSTTLISDLAVGQPPKITADEQQTVDRIIEANDYHQLIYDSIGDVLKFGNAVLKVRFDQRGIIERVNPKFWFPVVSPDDGSQVLAHVLAYSWTEFVDHVKTDFLRLEIHKKGTIENRLYELSGGGTISKEIYLSTLERFKDLKPELETGVKDFLIIPLHGSLQSNGVYGLDDYGDLEGLVEELEKRLIRTSKTLDKFSAPNIAGPSDVIETDPYTGEPVLTIGGGRYFGVDEDQKFPQYLTWDASLAANFSQIEEIKSELMAVGEISPALLGDTKNGLAESGSALKRLAIPTLAKVNRLRLRIKKPILEALRLCAELEVSSRLSGSSKLTNVALEWRSALPKDPLENAQVEATRKTANLTSTRGALARLDEDATETDLDTELEAIKDERNDEALSII